jgi:hypothetical protein
MFKSLKFAALVLLFAGASLARASTDPAATADTTPMPAHVLAASAQSVPCRSHLDLTASTAGIAGPKVASADAMQLASATDVHYCWVQCTPGSGCELVCRHLAY